MSEFKVPEPKTEADAIIHALVRRKWELLPGDPRLLGSMDAFEVAQRARKEFRDQQRAV